MKVGSFDNGQNDLIWLMRNRSLAETVNQTQFAAQTPAAAAPQAAQGSAAQPTRAPVRLGMDITSFLSGMGGDDLSAAQSAWGQLQAGGQYGAAATDNDGDADLSRKLGQGLADLLVSTTAGSQSQAPAGLGTDAPGLTSQVQGRHYQSFAADPAEAPAMSQGPAKATLFL